MNSKIYSILYCVLLASTLVHEVRGKSAPDFNPHQIDKRDVIPSEDELNVLILANVTIIVNVTAGTVIGVDVEANLVAVIDAKDGVIIVINLEKNVLIYNKVEANLDIETLIKKLENGLGVLLEIDGGITQSLESVTKDILEILIAIFYTFLDIPIDLNLYPEIGLRIFIATCRELLGVLKSIPYLLIKTIIILTTDLFGLINILYGLADISDCLTVKNCTSPNLLKVVDDAGIGFDVIADIISGTVNVKVNITCLAPTLNELETIIDLAYKFTADDDKILYGLSKLYLTIVKFINGSASLADLINDLLHFLYLVKTLGPSPLLGSKIKIAMTDLLKAIITANASQELSGLVANINSQLNGTLIYRGVNLSVILAVLLQVAEGGVTNVYEIIVKVVSLLGAVIDRTFALVISLIILVLDVLNPLAFGILKTLGIIVGAATNILKDLLNLIVGVLNGALNIVNFILGKLYEILVSIPIIGDIVKGLAEAISTVTGGAIDLKKILNSKEPITQLIKALLKLLGYKNVTGISGNATAIVNETLAHISDVGPILGIDIDISVNISLIL